jgi:hypothetical protein
METEKAGRTIWFDRPSAAKIRPAFWCSALGGAGDYRSSPPDADCFLRRFDYTPAVRTRKSFFRDSGDFGYVPEADRARTEEVPE